MPGSARYAAKISQDEVDALDQASSDIALAYQLIAENKPKCAAHVLPLLYRANLAVVKMVDKGAKAFVDYYRNFPPKHPSRISRVIEQGLREAADRDANPAGPRGE